MERNGLRNGRAISSQRGWTMGKSFYYVGKSSPSPIVLANLNRFDGYSIGNSARCFGGLDKILVTCFPIFNTSKNTNFLYCLSSLVNHIGLWWTSVISILTNDSNDNRTDLLVIYIIIRHSKLARILLQSFSFLFLENLQDKPAFFSMFPYFHLFDSKKYSFVKSHPKQVNEMVKRQVHLSVRAT